MFNNLRSTWYYTRFLNCAQKRCFVPAPPAASSSESVAEVACRPPPDSGLILGLYTNPDDPNDKGSFTDAAMRYNRKVCNRLSDLLSFSPPPHKGKVRIFYNLDPLYACVAVVGLGRKCQGYDVYEVMDEGKESIRIAAGAGCRALQDIDLRVIHVEGLGHAESAAEGSALSTYVYQDLKHKDHRRKIPKLELYDDCDWPGWQIGLQKADAQNLARELTETPASNMTPTLFAQRAVDVLCKTGINVEVKVRSWAETQHMSAFLAAARGSCAPPIFLELSYYGSAKDERPIVLIGKGITYNSGGLCLKTPHNQKLMRGDMNGAACLVAAIRAVANLELPLNVRCLIPLCENMPGSGAMKPGDVVRAKNGKHIKIISTDTAGRLCLADALSYAENFWPRFIIDVGTMTYEMLDALGATSSAVFTNSETLWEYMRAASMHTGDRVWRFPLWDHYATLIRHSPSVDVLTYNKRSKKSRHFGAPCEVAAFLNEFVPCGDWLHLDCYNVNYSNGTDYEYLPKGMSGRPTRTLVEFLSQVVCNRD